MRIDTITLHERGLSLNSVKTTGTHMSMTPIAIPLIPATIPIPETSAFSLPNSNPERIIVIDIVISKMKETGGKLISTGNIITAAGLKYLCETIFLKIDTRGSGFWFSGDSVFTEICVPG